MLTAGFFTNFLHFCCEKATFTRGLCELQRIWHILKPYRQKFRVLSPEAQKDCKSPFLITVLNTHSHSTKEHSQRGLEANVIQGTHVPLPKETALEEPKSTNSAVSLHLKRNCNLPPEFLFYEKISDLAL